MDYGAFSVGLFLNSLGLMADFSLKARLKWDKTVHAFPEDFRSDGQKAYVLFSPILRLQEFDGRREIADLKSGS